MLARGHHLRVVGLYGAGDDHNIGACNIAGVVADHHFRAQRLQSIHGSVLRQIGTGYRIVEVEQDLGDTRHPGTADSDEVDMFDLMTHARTPGTSAQRTNFASASGAISFCPHRHCIGTPAGSSCRYLHADPGAASGRIGLAERACDSRHCEQPRARQRLQQVSQIARRGFHLLHQQGGTL